MRIIICVIHVSCRVVRAPPGVVFWVSSAGRHVAVLFVCRHQIFPLTDFI